MTHLRVFFTLALLFSLFSLCAQQQQASPDLDNTLVEQFQELERRSGNYRANGIRYEVVRLTHFNALKASVFDSIAAAHTAIKDYAATVTKHTSEIEALNATLEETTYMLNAATTEKDSIALLGAVVSKGTYNAILWAVIVTLGLLLVLFVHKFRNSNTITRQAKMALADLEKEYEAHKRRALEREQKISRQLQDELNKHKK